MHAAFGKSGLLRQASDALLPVFTNRVENDQALGPQSHSGGPCSEGWLKSCLKSALQSTRSTTHCPALETWPEFPRVKRRLWGGELWEDGYFARTVGDKVTAEVIRRYIQQHRLEKTGDAQLSLFELVL